jgi:hypothetical protein
MQSIILAAIGVAIAGSLSLTPVSADAQAAPPNRVSGTIEAFDGHQLTVKPGTGPVVTIAVPEGTRVGALEERTLADIRPGDFVGSAAVEGPDGKLHAQEVHIFPEAMRGTGEGHHPMAGPKQSMTNATVATVAAIPKGHTLELNYKGGKQAIEVDPGTRVVLLVQGSPDLLKPGAAVAVFVTKAADGTLTARSVQAEKDGVKPLM